MGLRDVSELRSMNTDQGGPDTGFLPCCAKRFGAPLLPRPTVASFSSVPGRAASLSRETTVFGMSATQLVFELTLRGPLMRCQAHGRTLHRDRMLKMSAKTTTSFSRGFEHVANSRLISEIKQPFSLVAHAWHRGAGI